MGELLCAIHQPNFFPRLSTVAKLFTADIWVILDDVQFARRDYQHRCRVLGPDAVERWLTVPVHLPAGRPTLIRDVLVADPAYARSRVHGVVRHCHKGSPHWPAINGLLAQVEDAFTRSDRLADVSLASAVALLRALNWPGTIYRSSDLPARTGRSERLADLTRAVGADIYLCGTGGARYLDEEPFASRRVSVAYFVPPPSCDRTAPRRHLTALVDVAAAGPALLADRLTEHARTTASSSTRLAAVAR